VNDLNKSTISLQKTTRDRLSKYGSMSSTWDSVINELLDHVEKCDNYWSDRF